MPLGVLERDALRGVSFQFGETKKARSRERSGRIKTM
jgi:hypothetical protein